MTGKNVVITTVLVLACFTAAFLAYNYFDAQSIMSIVQQSAPINEQVTVEADHFEIEGKHNGKHHKKNVHPVRNSPAPVKSSSGTCYKVSTDTLNVRSSACGSASTTISRNTVVTAVGSASTKSGCSLGSTIKWQQISSPVNGYVSNQYLTAVACSSTPTPPPSSGELSLAQLKSCMPGISSSKATLYLPYLNSAMRAGSINTPRRMAAFLAQVGHESASFLYMEEIASGAAYEGRKDLGNIYPGDGKKYKGRGPIQITGRSNYDAAGKALGLDLINNPTQAATPQVGFRLAVWFWNRAGLSSYADQNTQSAFDTITRRINGGTNGKADRDSRWGTCKRVLGV